MEPLEGEQAERRWLSLRVEFPHHSPEEGGCGVRGPRRRRSPRKHLGSLLGPPEEHSLEVGGDLRESRLTKTETQPPAGSLQAGFSSFAPSAHLWGGANPFCRMPGCRPLCGLCFTGPHVCWTVTGHTGSRHGRAGDLDVQVRTRVSRHGHGCDQEDRWQDGDP